MKTYKCKIPTWAMNYMFNGETEGLTDSDLKAVQDWEKSWGGPVSISVLDETPYFSSSPEFGLACEVEDCEVLVEEA